MFRVTNACLRPLICSSRFLIWMPCVEQRSITEDLATRRRLGLE